MAKYSYCNNIFSVENVIDLSEYTIINNYTIKLEKVKQLLLYLIDNLELVELETLKIYIETNLANGFIRPSKSSTGALILFNQKAISSFKLCMDY